MMGRTHLTTGVTAGAWTGAVVSTFAPNVVALLAVPVVAYSALLPDLDHPRSTATYSGGPLTVLVSFVLRLFVDHRGPTHDARFAPAAFGIPAALASLALPAQLAAWWPVWGAAVAVGVLTHIWGDARTTYGVPGKHGRVTVGRTFRTGSRAELVLLRRVYRPAALGSLVLGALALAATA